MSRKLIMVMPAAMLATLSFGAAADQGTGAVDRPGAVVPAAGRTPVVVHFPASINSNGRIDDAFR